VIKGKAIKDVSIKSRLIEAGKSMFAERGFNGASVREICKMADASSTMIHHYFGSKEGLYNAIIEEFTSTTFDVPLRLIDKPPRTQEEFILRLEMFISETFRALSAQAPVFRIIAREARQYVGTSKFHDGFSNYLSAAQNAGFVSADLKIDLVTGLVLDRLGGQIMYASKMQDDRPNVLNDEAYAKEWLNANTTVLIHGLGGRP